MENINNEIKIAQVTEGNSNSREDNHNKINNQQSDIHSINSLQQNNEEQDLTIQRYQRKIQRQVQFQQDLESILNQLKYDQYNQKKERNFSGILTHCFCEINKRNFRIYKLISAKGGQGVVFEGINLDNKEKVAIKLINYVKSTDLNGKSTQEQKESLQQFYQELENEKQIINQIQSHRYIINIFEQFIIEEAQVAVQIMELCQKDLTQEILERKKNNSPFTEEEIYNLIYQLINSLQEIHVNNIIHLDIKPSNILIKTKGEYILADFGIAYLLQKNQKDCQQYQGYSPIYCSPEQKLKSINKGKPYSINMSSDVYSMGLTCLSVLGVDLTKIKIQGQHQYPTFETLPSNLSLFSFVKFNMLCIDPKLRKTSIQLKQLFMSQFGKKILVENEKERIENLLTQFDIKNIKTHIYKAFLLFEKNILNHNNLELQNQALHIIEDVLKESHPYYSSLLLQIANSYEKKGEIEIAIKYKEKSIKIIKQIYSSNHPELAEAYQSLSISYERKDLQKALKLQEESLSILKKIFQGDHPEIADSLSNLSLLQQKIGNFKESNILADQALEMREKIFNGIYFAELLEKLSNSYYQLKNYERASQYDKMALEIRIKLLKNDKNITIDKLNSICLLYQRLDEKSYVLSDYIEIEQQLLEMKLEYYKQNDHIEIANSLTNLGLLYYKKEYSSFQALDYNRKALKMKKNLFQNPHPEIAISLNNLALSYQSIGDENKAFKLNYKALEMRKQLYKGDHLDIADSLNRVAISYRRAFQNIEKQIEYEEESLQMKQNILKGNNHIIAQQLYNLSIIYQCNGEKEKYELFMKRYNQMIDDLKNQDRSFSVFPYIRSKLKDILTFLKIQK